MRRKLLLSSRSVDYDESYCLPTLGGASDYQRMFTKYEIVMCYSIGRLISSSVSK